MLFQHGNEIRRGIIPTCDHRAHGIGYVFIVSAFAPVWGVPSCRQLIMHLYVVDSGIKCLVNDAVIMITVHRLVITPGEMGDEAIDAELREAQGGGFQGFDKTLRQADGHTIIFPVFRYPACLQPDVQGR